MASEHLVSRVAEYSLLIEVCFEKREIYIFIYIEREREREREKRESSQLSVGFSVLHSQDIKSWL